MKRNLKIILALLLALALVFCAACTKDEPAQEPQEGTETENRDNPDATGSGAAQPEPEPAPDPYAEYNADAEKAFRQVVQNYVVLGELPGFDQDIPYSEYADGEWTDMYAILDIDGDGKNELLLRIAQTIMASMQENIYAYDQETGEVVQELWAFPICTYLCGGTAIQSGWSHGTGAEGPDFWPFNVFQYNAETDEYDLDGYCAQACLEAMKRWDGKTDSRRNTTRTETASSTRSATKRQAISNGWTKTHISSGTITCSATNRLWTFPGRPWTNSSIPTAKTLRIPQIQRCPGLPLPRRADRLFVRRIRTR